MTMEFKVIYDTERHTPEQYGAMMIEEAKRHCRYKMGELCMTIADNALFCIEEGRPLEAITMTARGLWTAAKCKAYHWGCLRKLRKSH